MMEDIDTLKKELLDFSKGMAGSCLLNDLVVDRYTIRLPEEDRTDENKTRMNRIVELAKQVAIQCDGKPEKYLAGLSHIQDDENVRFLNWLFDYMEEICITYKEGAPFRDMEPEKFQEMIQYCLENFILTLIKTDEIEEQWRGKEDELLGLRKIVYYYVKMILWDSRSKKYADDVLKEKFGLKREHCDVIFRQIEGKEDRLWRRVLAKRINHIENCLDELMEKIDSIYGVG